MPSLLSVYGALIASSLLASALALFWQWGALHEGTPLHTLLSIQGFVIALAGLGVAFVLSLFSWLPRFFKISWLLHMASTAWLAGILAARVHEHWALLEAPHIGLSNLYEVNLLLLFLLGFMGLPFVTRLEKRFLLMALGGLQVLLAGFTFWLVYAGQAFPRELVPALQNLILPFHVIANFVGYGAFMLSAMAALVVLFSKKKERVEEADRLSYLAIRFGFPIFTLAILLGCIWAYQAWGGYWSWDPKETWALVVWLLYAGYLHQRLKGRVRQKHLAWWSLVGFLATLFCYLGVNMFLSGLHSYGDLV